MFGSHHWVQGSRVCSTLLSGGRQEAAALFSLPDPPSFLFRPPPSHTRFFGSFPRPHPHLSSPLPPFPAVLSTLPSFPSPSFLSHSSPPRSFPPSPQGLCHYLSSGTTTKSRCAGGSEGRRRCRRRCRTRTRRSRSSTPSPAWAWWILSPCPRANSSSRPPQVLLHPPPSPLGEWSQQEEVFKFNLIKRF